MQASMEVTPTAVLFPTGEARQGFPPSMPDLDVTFGVRCRFGMALSGVSICLIYLSIFAYCQARGN